MKKCYPRLVLFHIAFILLTLLLTKSNITAEPGLSIGGNSFTFVPYVAGIPALPNGGWEELGGSGSGGGISNNSGISSGPAVAVDPVGTPYVAWSDDSSGVSQIYLRRWNGSSWEEVGSGSASGGGISQSSSTASWVSLAIASDGTLYAAWADKASSFWEIYVRRWNGSVWEEVGAGSASGGGISDNDGWSVDPMIAIAPDGTPYVVWEELFDDIWQTYIRRWNGNVWEEVGTGSASGGGISNNPGWWSWNASIAFSPTGTPYVAWSNRLNNDEDIFIRHWNGVTWEEVGAGSASGGGISNTGRSFNPSLSITPDGTPYVAWHHKFDSPMTTYVYIRRWNGAFWEEVGTGSASGDGISITAGSDASLAVTPNNLPYVSWTDHWYDNPDSEFQIYARGWNGSNWTELGAGSAIGGGISGTGGMSPFLAIAPDSTTYAAWYDDGSGNDEIYLRWWK